MSPIDNELVFQIIIYAILIIFGIFLIIKMMLWISDIAHNTKEMNEKFDKLLKKMGEVDRDKESHYPDPNSR